MSFDPMGILFTIRRVRELSTEVHGLLIQWRPIQAVNVYTHWLAESLKT